MKPDTATFIGLSGLMLTVVILLLELRDSNQMAANYREVAYRATTIGESCAKKLESAQAEWPVYLGDMQSL